MIEIVLSLTISLQLLGWLNKLMVKVALRHYKRKYSHFTVLNSFLVSPCSVLTAAEWGQSNECRNRKRIQNDANTCL